MWFDSDPPSLIERLQRRAIDFLLDHFLAFYAAAVTIALAGWAPEFLP
jgi:hypothetical protein